MTHVYSAQQNKAMDQATWIDKRNTSFELMSYAARMCTEVLVTKKLVCDNQTIVVVCGVGNNGGDGLLIGSELLQRSLNVKIMMVNHPDSWSKDVQQALRILQNDNIDIQWITNADEHLLQTLNQANIIIDALLGIGTNRMCDAQYISLIEVMNHSQAQKISVDIPSGLNATSGFAQPIAVIAGHTLVIGALNQGHVLFDGWDTCGSKHFVDIGLHKRNDSNPMFIPNTELRLTTPSRKHNVHKYSLGHVLLVGGSKSMMGSVMLSSLSALRSGAGLVSLAIHPDNQAHLRGLALEIMTPDYEDKTTFEALLFKKSSVVYGMGLSKHEQPDYVLSTLLESEVPLVIDADGLTHWKPLLEKKHKNHVLVLTPHLMELSRLTNQSIEQVKQDPIQVVQNLAKKAQAIVLLKGPSSILSDGLKTEILEVGNPGLATAGTGDVLAGIVGALVGQQTDGFEAVKQALILFDQAARLAKEEQGEHGMIASDVITHLPKAFIKSNNK